MLTNVIMDALLDYCLIISLFPTATVGIFGFNEFLLYLLISANWLSHNCVDVDVFILN